MRIFRNIENKMLYYFEINYGFGNYFRKWIAYPYYLNKNAPLIEIGNKLDTQNFDLEFEV
jgi:hypothetical protein